MGRFLFTFLLACLINLINAQPWFENAKDANGNLNYYLIRQNAEKYFEGKETEKGKGFKPYKRWEHYWEYRINEDGTFPEAGITERNWAEYLKNAGKRNRTPNGNWTSLGPNTTTGGYNGLGRINCVAFHPTDENIIWVGSPGGGLWKSTDGGNTWTTGFDNSVVLGVSGIVIHPNNPDIMYIATGDGDGYDTPSTGVLKSTDGGMTWQITELNWSVNQNRVIRRVIMDPDNYDMLLAATSNGLYRTTDAGNSWTIVVTGNFYDVRANPQASSNRFYAARGNTLFLSTDNGANWSSVHTISGANRIALGVSSANSNYVYALCSQSSDNGFLGLYRSTDSGNSYSLRSSAPNLLGWSQDGSDSGGQGWYDLCIAVDPTNAEIVYTGGVNTWKSIDGGQTWTLNTMWYNCGGCAPAVHADKHCMEFQNNTKLWQGNDGGIYYTTNGGSTWVDKSNGLVISQLYSLDVSQTDNKIITGLQDNGTKIKTNSGNWIDRIGGDGMECAIRPDNAAVLYGSIYYGRFYRSTNGGNSFSNLTVPDQNTGAWITPFLIDPAAPQTIYAAYKRVHKSTDQGNTWTTISGNLNSNNLNYLHVAPSNSNYIYTGLGNVLYRTTDGGINWDTMTVPGNNVRELAIHPGNPDIIWAVRSNYISGAKVYKSVNGGSTWTNVSGGLPNLPVNCIVYQEGTDDGIYVGMDVGIFYRDNNLADWELFNNGLPNVEITDLKIKYDSGEIYAATYGRGTWKSPLRNSGSICSNVQALSVDSINYQSAFVFWTINHPNNYTGYNYGSTNTPTPPILGISTTDTSAVISNLNSNTDYYFHVRAICDDTLFSSWTTIGPVTTWTTCGDLSTDTGGQSQNYSNDENTIRYICPNGPYQQVEITFTDFQVEANWDALYIHNGNSIQTPLFSSGNPATNSGFPPGGFWGGQLPGTFISTHTSGCLTLHFRSDGSVTQRGWEATVDCIENCAQSVRFTDDDGLGTLRNVIACLPANDTVSFEPIVNGDTIRLLSPIIIDKNINIMANNQFITIEALHDGYIFEILPNASILIENVNFIGGKGNNDTRVFFNQGTLNLNSVDILDVKAGLGTGKSIENLGTLNFSQNCTIREN